MQKRYDFGSHYFHGHCIVLFQECRIIENLFNISSDVEFSINSVLRKGDLWDNR